MSNDAFLAYTEKPCACRFTRPVEPRRSDELAWKRWRRKPEVRAHLRAYKRAWRAKKREEGVCPT